MSSNFRSGPLFEDAPFLANCAKCGLLLGNRLYSTDNDGKHLCIGCSPNWREMNAQLNKQLEKEIEITEALMYGRGWWFA